MKNKELYQKTVDILVQAYFNDTLEHSNCSACAVGNIIAANNGIEFERVIDTPLKVYWKGENHPSWDIVFSTAFGKQERTPEYYAGNAKDQIDSTGYAWQELAKVEYAFECAKRGRSNDEHMFNGLMAVIDVLDEIHENKDTEATTKTKARFKKELTTP